MNLFKRMIDKALVDYVTNRILELYDVYEKGMRKHLIDSNLGMFVEINKLKERIQKLEESK